MPWAVVRLPSARSQAPSERGMDAGVQLHENPEAPVAPYLINF